MDFTSETHLAQDFAWEPREQTLLTASIFAGGGSGFPVVAQWTSRSGDRGGVLVLWGSSTGGRFLISPVLWHDLNIAPGKLTLSIVLHLSSSSVRYPETS